MRLQPASASPHDASCQIPPASCHPPRLVAFLRGLRANGQIPQPPHPSVASWHSCGVWGEMAQIPPPRAILPCLVAFLRGLGASGQDPPGSRRTPWRRVIMRPGAVRFPWCLAKWPRFPRLVPPSLPRGIPAGFGGEWPKSSRVTAHPLAWCYNASWGGAISLGSVGLWWRFWASCGRMGWWHIMCHGGLWSLRHVSCPMIGHDGL